MNPHLTQRHLSQKLSVSLGKINFLIRALVDKGLIEIKNFKESKNKLGYVYMVTPKGIQIKLHLTQQYIDNGKDFSFGNSYTEFLMNPASEISPLDDRSSPKNLLTKLLEAKNRFRNRN
jgi:EPS-associated MarR family transcriptional regulator